MKKEIFVPPLGESITSAVIATIHKNKGENILADEILFELETDKVTLEVNAPIKGIVSSLAVSVGDEVSIGDLLGIIDNSTRLIEKKGALVDQPKAYITPLKHKQDAPSAKKLMSENNITREDIVTKTGKDQRVTKPDVQKHLSIANEETVICTETPKNHPDDRKKHVKMSKLRQKIAERLKESQNTAAILTTFNEIDMQNVMNLRATYKETFLKKYSIKLGFMSFFIKSVIAALREVSEINAEISGNDIVYKNYYDMGVAVGTEQGLVVPVIRDADKLSIAGIESEIFRLGSKAKAGKLTLAEMQGATFTISNGGVYGSLLSTPIINPPQSGILGMHSIQKRAVVIHDKIEIRPMMYTALSYDHRIVDGKAAVTFLVKLKQYIEDPHRLLLEL